MNDLEELAALNRQIAERDQIIRALLQHVEWYDWSYCSPCYFCGAEVNETTNDMGQHINIECDHLPTCKWSRAMELTADADKDTR